MFTPLVNVLILAFFGAIQAVDVTVNPSLDASLITAATHLDRQALLSKNSDWLFDFKAHSKYTVCPNQVSHSRI